MPRATRQPRATMSATGAMPDRIPRLELVLTAIVTPRAASRSSSSGRACVQCARGEARREQADAVEVGKHAVREGAVGPVALVAGL